MAKKMARTSKGLRDVLFDEIESLRSGDGDPSRALAVANLAKQVINTVKVELDYHREALRLQETGSPLKLGSVELGSGASAVEQDATERSASTTHATGSDGKEVLRPHRVERRQPSLCV